MVRSTEEEDLYAYMELEGWLRNTPSRAVPAGREFGTGKHKNKTFKTCKTGWERKDGKARCSLIVKKSAVKEARAFLSQALSLPPSPLAQPLMFPLRNPRSMRTLHISFSIHPFIRSV